jgi:hypothetical protein
MKPYRVKLSPVQAAMLRRMAASHSGIDLTPGGYSAAGPDASRWWRTARILEGHGFVKRCGWQAVSITAKGLAWLAEPRP